MRGRVRTLAVVAVALVSVAACSPSSVTGVPTAAGTTSTPRGSGTSFDPCTDIADAQVTSYGLDPTAREITILQEVGLGKGCGWKNKDVLVAVVVTDQTVNDLVRRGFFNTKKMAPR